MILGAFMRRAPTGVPGPSPVSNSGTAAGSSAAASNASATLTFNSTGAITKSGTAADGSFGSAAWLDSVGSGKGAPYWMRVTVLSGSLASGTTGVWQQMNVDRTLTIGPATTGAASCVVTVEFAMDSAGAIVLTSGSWTLGYSHTGGGASTVALSNQNRTGDSSITCSLKNDGTLYIQDASNSYTGTISGQWLTTSPGVVASTIADDYDVMFTYVSGPNTTSGSTNTGRATKSGEAFATWLNLGITRTIALGVTAGTISGTASGTLVFDVDIRPAGGGATLAHARMTIGASV